MSSVAADEEVELCVLGVALRVLIASASFVVLGEGDLRRLGEIDPVRLSMLDLL